MVLRKPEWLLGAFSGAKNKKFFIPHTWRVFLEIVAVCLLLLALAGGAFAWRLMQGPIDLGFARQYIQEALRNPESGIAPVIGDAVISWPRLSGPIMLGFKDVHLYDRQGHDILSVDEAAVSVSLPRLLIGKITPTALILRQPFLRVARSKDGSVSVGVSSPQIYGPPKPKTEAEGTGLFKRAIGYILNPESARDKSPLASLRALRIENATAVFEDEGLRNSWIMPRLDAVLERSRQGAQASADAALSLGQGTEPSFLKLDLNYPRGAKEGRLMAELKNFDPWFFARSIPGFAGLEKGDAILSAQIGATLDPGLKPLQAMADISSSKGKFSSPALSKAPIEYADLRLKASFDAGKKELIIENSGAKILGVGIGAAAELKISDAVLSGPLRVSINRLEQKKIRDFWPPMLEGDAAEKWIAHKLSEGVFTDLYAEMNVAAGFAEGDVFTSVKNLVAGFKFEGMKVDYRPPLMPVTQGRGGGKFILDEERLNISVESGKIGDMEIRKADLEFANIISKGKGVANIHARIGGPLRTGLEYVAAEPISMKREFDLNKVRGAADLDVNVDFPTHHDIKKEEVKVSVEGDLRDVFLPGIVRELELTGGPLKISVKGKELHVRGSAAVGGAAGTIDYREFAESPGAPYAETVRASLNTSPDMRRRLGIDLSDFVEGVLPVEISYAKKWNGAAHAEIISDMTPARFFIGPFDYDKLPGAAAKATLEGEFLNGELSRVKNMHISAPGLSISGAALSFRKNGPKTEIAAGEFGNFTVGETRLSCRFDVDKYGRYAIEASSPAFDLRPFLNHEPKKTPYDDPPMVIDLTAKTMKGADGSILRNGKFHIDIDGGGKYESLEISAALPKGSMALRFGPGEGGARTFRMNSDNAGAALAAFGVYQNIRGGDLSVRGRAKNAEGRDIFGSAEIKDFRVVKAPTLARLVSALSLPGLAALLNNEGLKFTKLQADFTWNYRPGGSFLLIKDGRTSGNSVGFSFDGKVDLAESTLDIEGTMVPLSDINKFIGKIPLVGDILTGGSGLIAATYSVRGKTAEPGVMVNPLSVLAPGILRRILFE